MQLNMYLLYKSVKHVCELNMLVSSAKSIGFIISETRSMPFIYKMKSNGPNMDPCGTPQDISL